MDGPIWERIRAGQAYVTRGELDLGIRYLAEARALAREAEDRNAAGYAVAAIAGAHLYRREAGLAEPLVAEALESLPPDDLLGRALAFNVRGNLAWLDHDIVAARRDFEASRALYRAAGDGPGEARSLLHLGMLHAFRGAYREADRRYRQCLDLLGEHAAPSAEAWGGLAHSRLWQGHRQGAADALAMARKHLESTRAPQATSRIDLIEAQLRFAEGDVGPARDMALAAKEGAEDLGDAHGAARAKVLLAEIALHEGNALLAGHLATEAWEQAAPPDQTAFLTLFGLAPIWRASGRTGEAEKFLDSAVGIARKAGAMHLLAHLLAQRPAGQRESRALEEAFGFGPAPGPQVDASPRLRLVTLGEFRVEWGGQPIADAAWGGRKPRVALVALAAHPEGLTRARFAELCGMDDAVPGAVHVLIGRIRSALATRGGPEAKEAIESRDGQYRLVMPGTVWWDAARLEGLAADAANPANRQEILDLYGGPFLPEFEEYPWAAAQTARLHAKWLESAEAALAADRAAMQWPYLLARAERILEVDPLAECAHRAVLEALIRTGRRSAAQRHWEAFERQLRADVGTAPEAATRALWESLSTESPSFTQR
jgi:DNA-binding SARP family transcriptional activator